jgi:glycosyltransferase involved in cell wall biosynthesis
VRILIDASSTTGSGAGFVRLQEIARDLPQQGREHQFALVVHPTLRHVIEEQIGTSSVLISPPPRLSGAHRRVAWQLGLLPRAARAFQPDAVLALFNVVASRWPQPAPRVAVMVSNLLPFFRELNQPVPRRHVPRLLALRRLTEASIERADLVLFQSHYAAGAVGRACKVGRSAVIGHVPPNTGVGASAVSRWQQPYLLVVADQYHYKGIEIAIEALALIPSRRRPRLVLVGDRADVRYARQVDRLISRLGLNGDVSMLGQLPHDEVLGLMGAASVFLAPSRFENLSRLPGEAMAAGAPLICSDIEPHREAAGNAALYYPPDEARGLANRIEAVMQEEDVRVQLKSRAAARVAGARQDDALRQLIRALEGLQAEPLSTDCR